MRAIFERSLNISVITFLCLTGCVTLSPEAEKIQVHSEVSSLLEQCKKIGPANATSARIFGPAHATESAKSKLREEVHKKGGDTVAILNTDVFLTKVTIQGIAFRCY